MGKYIIRLDDASEFRDVEKWNRIEEIFDRYGVKPLVGVIPNNKDEKLTAYEKDEKFWERVHSWMEKGWKLALHGYDHVYLTKDGGINPINKKSEFAGVPLDVQREKIKKGVEILRSHGINPKVFFAPAHTFDENTLIALKEESDIRIISDTIATKPYTKYGFTFVPQTFWNVRNAPFSINVFCYHPNYTTENDFEELEKFLDKNSNKFVEFPINQTKRKISLYDKLVRFIIMNFKNLLIKIFKR